MAMNGNGKIRSQRVGIISRIDCFSRGFRRGLVRLNFERMTSDAGIHFAIIAGGLVSSPDFKRLLKEGVDAAKRERAHELAREHAKPKNERSPVRSIAEIKETTERNLLQQAVDDLTETIPRLRNAQGRPLKIYIVTSPALNYDGEIGVEVAQRLSALRDDIVWWGQEDVRFPLKGLYRRDAEGNKTQEEKDFWVVLPKKAAWRSRYFSTRPDRLVEDKEMQTRQDMPDLWISDCAAVALMRPAGGIARPRISTPGSHRLQEVTTSENQIGACVVEFFDVPRQDHNSVSVRMISLDDFVADERAYIANPSGISGLQTEILDELKKHPRTVGMLEDLLGRARSSIEKAVASYQQAGHEPFISYDSFSKRYDIHNGWMQQKLTYPFPDTNLLQTDTILAFGCLHAGYETTQYAWWSREVPKLIVRHGVKTVVGAGDYIAGLKHNLHLRGEVIAGMNYTEQQGLAARMIAVAFFKAFRILFDRGAKAIQNPNLHAIEKLADTSLVTFNFYQGNHDKWLLDEGVDPIAYLHSQLVDFLTKDISAHLAKHGYVLPGIEEMVRRHIVFADEHTLPSGLVLGINHPEMARAGTSSLRAQATLDFRPNVQVEVLANFHTGILVLAWRKDLGQRAGLQVGTIVSGTDFEAGKLKRVDTSVGIMRIRSWNGRIVDVETSFAGPTEKEMERTSSGEIIRATLKARGISP